MTNEWRREKSYQDAISLLTKETEITGDIVFLLPEKFTHKIEMACKAFNSSHICQGPGREQVVMVNNRGRCTILLPG